MAAEGGAGVDREVGGQVVIIHPLALISISDHYTRAKLQPSDRNTALLRGGATAVTWDDAAIFPADEDDETPPDPGLVYPDGTPRAIGIIFGRVVEGRVHILYSVELHCRVDSAGMPHFSGSYLDTQLDLIGKVYPDYELLGWYSSGVEPTPADYDFHRRLINHPKKEEKHEMGAPLYVMVNPDVEDGARELPVSVYELQTVASKDGPQTVFVAVDNDVDAEEAERITVDHIAKVSRDRAAPKGASAVYPTYANAKEATAMLMERIDTLIAVLRATQAGEVPTDHEMLRKISAICAQLPTTRSEAFESAFLSEFNDSMLVTYLSTMTKSAHQLSELLSKVQAGYPRGRDRGAFGFMM